MHAASRRQFLKSAAKAGVVGMAASPWLQMHAMAQDAASGASDYKALICLFLYGGNDGNNLIVPLDDVRYKFYGDARGRLALPRPEGQNTAGRLLPVTLTNPEGVAEAYGLHPAFARMQALFTSGQAALLANTGPLAAPTSKAQYDARSVPLPSNLFSHADQQSLWQSDSYGPQVRGGWGGRMIERLVDAGTANRGYSCVSVSGGALWGTGDAGLLPYRVPASGQFGMEGYTPGGTDPFSVALQAMFNESRTDAMETAWLEMIKRASDNQRILAKALEGQQATTVFPGTELGQQLQMIAKLIQAGKALGLKRQCFFCSIGGFDTHENQLPVQQGKFAEIDAAVACFQDEMNLRGQAQQVSLFTASDFGRTLIPNGNNGTDHGWGNHHFVVGGAVNGGRLYGRFPSLDMKDLTGHLDGGNWIPTLSLDQVGAEMARWFGVVGSVDAIFPNAGNFPGSIGLFKA